jgi:hypothetical protein
MDDSDATVLSLLENQAALQRDLVQAKDPSKFKLGYCGHMYLGHFNPSVQRLAETTGALWATARLEKPLVKAAKASRRGSSIGGKGSWKGIRRSDLESKWLAIKTEARTIRKADPAISQDRLADKLIDAARKGRLLLVSKSYLIGCISKWEKDGTLPRSAARPGRKPKRPPI